MKHRLGLLTLLLAYLLWLPGISQPLLTLTGSIDKARLVVLGKEVIADSPGVLPMVGRMAASLFERIEVSGQIQAYEKTRSIVGTIDELIGSGNLLVAFLVALFSVLIPLAKGLLLAWTSLRPGTSGAYQGKRIGDLIARWSMADVFVVAVIVAYLAAGATRNMDEIFTLDAQFGVGFWCFLAYCLLSIAATQLMRVPVAVVAQETMKP